MNKLVRVDFESPGDTKRALGREKLAANVRFHLRFISVAGQISAGGTVGVRHRDGLTTSTQVNKRRDPVALFSLFGFKRAVIL